MRKAFTLVELLVVIAIISLLISILAPSLNIAKDIAKQIVCGSNCASTAKGMLLYGEVNSDKYPPFRMGFSKGKPIINDRYLRVERCMWQSKKGDLNPVTLKQMYRGAGIIYGAGFIKSPNQFYCPAQDNPWWKVEEYTTNHATGETVAWGTFDNWSDWVRTGYFFNTWGKAYPDIGGTGWDIAFRLSLIHI